MRKKGYSLTRVEQEFGVGKSTVVKQQEKILLLKKRGFIQRVADDSVLDIWFTQEISKGSPISGPLLIEKACLMYKLLHPGSGNDFKASLGWLQYFKERHGIGQLKLQGESLSADHDAVEPFCEVYLRLHCYLWCI